MRNLRSVVVTGAAAATLAISGAALAQTPQTHVMTVALPGGGVAEIQYTGNVPPRVTVGDVPAPLAGWTPVASLFGPDSPFAAMERISAEMDREAAAMFRQTEALAAEARSGQPIATAFGNLPPGSHEYSFVSTMSGNGVCSRSVEITSTGNGPPRVVSHSSGNCAAGMPRGGAAGAAIVPTAPTPAKRPDVLLTNAGQTPSYTGLVRPAAAAR